MAKINSTTMVITLSKLVKNNEPDAGVLDDAIKPQLEEIIKELAGPNVLIEIEES
jgi:hypothetical protein